MSVVDFKKIWEVYEISKRNHRNICKNIRIQWRSYLKEIGKPEEFSWRDLSKMQQDTFIYCKIRSVMMKNYVLDEEKTKKRIERNIENYIANSLLNADDIIRERNDSIDYMFEERSTKTPSDNKKIQNYNELCRGIQAFNKIIPLPTFEAFKRNESMRAYDYAMSFYNSRVDPEDIAGVYMRIILQALEEKLGLKTDYYLIEECLSRQADFFTYLREKEIEFDDFDKVPTEYDENMGISREDYEELKKEYAAYLSSKKKLKDLKSFYKYEK